MDTVQRQLGKAYLFLAAKSSAVSGHAEKVGRLMEPRDDHDDAHVLDTILQPLPTGDVLCKEAFDDVDFFGTRGVFQTLKTTGFTRGGSRACRHILSCPTSDRDTLGRRAELLQRMCATMHSDDIAVVTRMAALEQDVLWFLDSKDTKLSALLDVVFFNMKALGGLNSNGHVLTLTNLYKIIGAPIVGIISPIAYFIVPFLVMCASTGTCVPFVPFVRRVFEYLTSGPNLSRALSVVGCVLVYFSQIFTSLEVSTTLYDVSKHLVNRMVNVHEFLRGAAVIVGRFGGTPFTAPCPTSVEPLECGVFSLHTNFGAVLASYKQLDPSHVRATCRNFYYTDAFIGLSVTKAASNLTFANFLFVDGGPDIARPARMDVKDIWHPALGGGCDIVRNDVDCSKSMIITGPNSAGKSVYIKAILINAIMCQTCGLSFSASCTMTPFQYIGSQINTPDCSGRASLFEAEMYRCKAHMDKVETGVRSLIVIDEIFSSTNPIEGISGAFAVAKRMAAFPSTVLILTTHHTYLTKLAKQTDNFRNYRMNVRVQGGKINRPFKLERGVSAQLVALELLRLNGFDDSIVAEAIRVKSDIHASHSEVKRRRETEVEDVVRNVSGCS